MTAARYTPPPRESGRFWKRRVWDREEALRVMPQELAAEIALQGQAAANVISLRARQAGRRLSLLDLGCGTGVLTRRLAADSLLAEVTIVDINPAALQTAATRLAPVVAVRALEIDLNEPLPELGTYDAILCLDTLHSLNDPPEIVSYARSHLKPLGVFVGNVLAAETFVEWLRHRYGVVRSYARMVVDAVALNTGQSSIRRILAERGAARLVPLRLEAVRSLLADFTQANIRTSYYHRFACSLQQRSLLPADEEANE